VLCRLLTHFSGQWVEFLVYHLLLPGNLALLRQYDTFPPSWQEAQEGIRSLTTDFAALFHV